MEPHIFIRQIELLTGRSLIKPSSSEEDFLLEALKDDEKIIDWSQFNELLLIVNKDRVTEAFFNYFFGTTCSIDEINDKVEKFRKRAMLCFGNFIYAYRTLSKAKTEEQLRRYLGGLEDPKAAFEKIQSRRNAILEITPIVKAKTHLVGYLSAGEITQEYEIATALTTIVGSSTTWEEIRHALKAMREDVEAKQKDDVVVRKMTA